MGMCQQKLQAGLDIYQGLTAQRYTDEIFRPHFEPHIDGNALADSTVLMGVGQNLPQQRCMDKSGPSRQCDQPPIVSQESRY